MDDEQELLNQAEEELEQLSWWIPGEKWWNQDQRKLREWHDEVTKHLKRG